MAWKRIMKTFGKVAASAVVAFVAQRTWRRVTEVEQGVEVEVEAVAEREVEKEVEVEREVEVKVEVEVEKEDVEREGEREVEEEVEEKVEEKVQEDEVRECEGGAKEVVEVVESEVMVEEDELAVVVGEGGEEKEIGEEVDAGAIGGVNGGSGAEDESREDDEIGEDCEEVAGGIVIRDHGVVDAPVVFNTRNYYRVDYDYDIPVGHLRSFINQWNPTVLYGGPILREGGFGTVALSQDEYGYVCALKSVEYCDEYQAASMSPLVRREMELQARCASGHVVGAYGYWETEYDANLAFEFMPFGNVEASVFQGSEVEGRAVSEERAAIAVGQAALALATCHHRGGVHCDLKMANILIGENGVLKLSDFGLAVEVDEDEKTDVRSFEPQFAAPELRGRGRYGCAVDMWSLGILMYELLTGTRRWHLAICANGRDYIPGLDDEVSEDAKDLLLGLLSEEEGGRPSARDVLSHRWVVRCGR